MTTDSVTKPRDAASLILYRRNKGVVELLLGQRPGHSSFMPDVYVFPGGGLERQDANIPLVGTLDNRIVSRIAVGGSIRRASQLVITAVRETFEETGLMIAQPGRATTDSQITLPEFTQHQLYPDAGLFRYVGRAITPNSQPKRFHARFFACDTSQITRFNKQVIKGNGELLDLQWFNIDQVEQLPMRSVTRFMIDEFLSLDRSGAEDWIGSVVYTHRNGKLSIRHDSGKR